MNDFPKYILGKKWKHPLDTHILFKRLSETKTLTLNPKCQHFVALLTLENGGKPLGKTNIQQVFELFFNDTILIRRLNHGVFRLIIAAFDRLPIVGISTAGKSCGYLRNVGTKSSSRQTSLPPKA